MRGSIDHPEQVSPHGARVVLLTVPGSGHVILYTKHVSVIIYQAAQLSRGYMWTCRCIEVVHGDETPCDLRAKLVCVSFTFYSVMSMGTNADTLIIQIHRLSMENLQMDCSIIFYNPSNGHRQRL